jgi:hypothetical protein
MSVACSKRLSGYIKLGVRALIVVLGIVALAAGSDRADSRRFSASASTSDAVAPPEPARPKAPGGYRVPKGALRVSTSQQLRAALANPKRTDIVLAGGMYDNNRPFMNSRGHRIYAARLGQAILRAGINIGANSGGSGALVRGVVFDVRDRAKTLRGALVTVWGSATNARVLDTVLRGNRVMAAGIFVRQPAGFVAKRIIARNFTDYGVLVDANELDANVLDPRFVLEDLDVANVSRRPPRSSNGTAEACVWIGNTGIARRLRVRNCGWMGVWTGTSTTKALVEDVDVDRTRTGIYIEHFTRDSTFQTIHVGPRVRIGILGEWAHPDWGERPGSIGNTIQDSIFESFLCGVYLDAGTIRTTVRRSAFRKQRWAAIGNYRGTNNAFYANDYSGIRSTAKPVSADHLSEAQG